MAWGAQSSLTPGSALLAAPRTHYLADSGECVSLQPSPGGPLWQWGPEPELEEMLEPGREEGALERLGQGRAGGSARRGQVREAERGGSVALKGEAGDLARETDFGERNISTGGSQAGNELELEGDRAE